MSATRILIVNADDFGLSHGVNGGIVRAFEEGIVTSASLMVRWPAAFEAARYAREHPRLGMGLHVDLGEWASHGGDWVPIYEVTRGDDEEAVRAEVNRQLGMFRELVGREPDHLDSHQHVHRRGPAALVLAEAAGALGVPLRHASPLIHYRGDFYGQTADGVPLPGALAPERLVAILRELPPGVTELTCHPGLADGLHTMYRDEREEELSTLCDPRVLATAQAEGILLRTFGELRPAERVTSPKSGVASGTATADRRSCFILGSGRSGTSMLAGTLHASGYFLGDRLISGDAANPKGYFEDREFESINEALLAGVTPTRPGAEPDPRADAGGDKPVYGWRWLTRIPAGTSIDCPPYLAGRMMARLAQRPFAYKDPRLCYTLLAWRPFAPEAASLCIFREPSRTAESIVTFCRNASDPDSIDPAMNFDKAVSVWVTMYRNVVDYLRAAGDWLFLHYDQLLDGTAVPSLERLLGTGLETSFPDARLQRSASAQRAGAAAERLYGTLCELAGYRP
jgi:predicted glycoside hydrolase/deacetylase ChbG (UPF0249 family)